MSIETFKAVFKKGENTGFYGISLVGDPAMESVFLALKNQEKIEFKTADQEKRIVCGAVLIPDKLIYRNQDGREFNIVFDAQTIREASHEFFRQGYQNNSTLEHDTDRTIEGVTVVESWIKEDEVHDKSVMLGMNEPVGTLFASMKIDNDEIWNDYIKTGKVKGFSIDGFFGMEKINLNSNINMSEKSLKETVVELFKEGFASLGLSKKEETEVKLGTMKSTDGTLEVVFDGEMAVLGGEIWVMTPDGQKEPLPDGEYQMESDQIWVIANGKLAEFKDKPSDDTPNDQSTMSAEQQTVKSEKVTSEVVYNLSKNDFNAFALEVAKQIEASEKRMKAEFQTEFTKVLESQVTQLTKNKPAEQKPYEQMTELEKHRAAKLN